MKKLAGFPVGWENTTWASTAGLESMWGAVYLINGRWRLLLPSWLGSKMLL